MDKRLCLTIVLILISLSAAGCFSSYPEDIKYYKKPHEVDTTCKTVILEPPDQVQVFCTEAAKIHEKIQQIRPDGKISFEGFGEFTAAGKTPEELAEEIRLKVVEFFNLEYEHPVDVRITALKSKVYYVLGQVNSPGPRLYTGRDSVLTAISSAEPNPMAWIDRIQIIRPSKDENVRPAIFELNFDKMMAHGDTTQNVLLQEGDIIYVPPTILGWIALKVEEAIRPIARAFSGVYTVRRGLDDRYY